MYQIAVKWTEYTPRVLDLDKGIFAGEFSALVASYLVPCSHPMVGYPRNVRFHTRVCPAQTPVYFHKITRGVYYNDRSGGLAFY